MPLTALALGDDHHLVRHLEMRSAKEQSTRASRLLPSLPHLLQVLVLGTVLCTAAFGARDAAAQLAAGQATDAVRVSGTIDAVTVLPDRALVRRTLSFAVQRATGTLRFHSLPVALLRESVRAQARGVTITSVAVRPTTPASEKEWRNHPLKLELDRIDQALQQERDRITNLQEQLRFLGSLGSVTANQSERELRTGTVKTDGWRKAADFLEERRAAYQLKTRQASLALQRLALDREEAQNKLNEAMVARRRSPVEVEVGYAGRAGSGAVVTLEYAVTNVSWTPLYDLRGSAEGGAFQLVSSAAIRQSSGEAWENVKLTLSTARPAVGTAPGMLEPWRLTQRSLAPPVAPPRRNLSSDNNQNFGPGAQTATASGSTTMAVDLPGRETIVSDNADHRVVLRQGRLATRLTHVTIPLLTPQVFLRARLQNSTGIPLLHGTVNLFLDGNFVGTSTFNNLAAAGEEFDIYLGPDQRLQVKRTLIRGDVEGSGLFSKKVTVKNQWQIELANFSGRPRQVVVLDQFPISGDPSIEAAFAGATRAPDRRDANGLLRWTVDVQHGRRERFDFSYTLTVPRPLWDRLEAQAAAQERAAAPGYGGQAAPPAPAAAPPSPSRARPRRVYNLEQIFQH
jgi:uncharacterized protein (TIGR02231 family)